ncbi:MAG TPA: hypothetical protein VGM62_15160 [Chthoniobacterales bacterium]|jgi:hypothetical protein
MAAEPLAGRWEGSVQIPGNELNVVIDLSPDSNNAWVGSIIIPGLGIKGLSLKDIVVKGPDATFSTKGVAGRGLDATFKVHLNGSGTLAGDFVQGGNTAPFQLKQIGPPQVDLPPRSTVVSKELEGEWVGEYQLLGYGRKVSLKLTNNDKQIAAAEFIVVGKRVNNLPVDLVTQEGSLLNIYSHETGITFEGRFRTSGGEIHGTIVQGPFEAPLVLHRKS